MVAPSGIDRKSTRLNSSHRCISYAVFCLKKKKPPHSSDFSSLFAATTLPLPSMHHAAWHYRASYHQPCLTDTSLAPTLSPCLLSIGQSLSSGHRRSFSPQRLLPPPSSTQVVGSPFAKRAPSSSQHGGWPPS